MDDFIELVYECMGKDAAKYLREQIDELQTELDYFYSN